MEDPEKKKKKEDKAREKQLKKEKFFLKQAERQVQLQHEQEQRSFHASKKNERKNAKHGAEDENSEDYVDPETPSGGMIGGRNRDSLWQMLAAPNHHLLLFFLHQM